MFSNGALSYPSVHAVDDDEALVGLDAHGDHRAVSLAIRVCDSQGSLEYIRSYGNSCICLILISRLKEADILKSAQTIERKGLELDQFKHIMSANRFYLWFNGGRTGNRFLVMVIRDLLNLCELTLPREKITKLLLLVVLCHTIQAEPDPQKRDVQL